MNPQLAPSPPLPPVAPSAPDTFLSPADPFPSALAELDLTELQVLHSRVCRRLEQEYLTDPDGPHPVTQDRCQELVAELDTRQQFLAPPVRLTEVPSGSEPAPGEEPAPEEMTERSGGPSPAPESAPSIVLVPGSEPPAREAVGTGEVLHDLGELRPGDRIEVWHRGLLHCRGTVEEVCPALGVAWLREAGDGYRRMVHAHDSELRRIPST